MAKTKKKNLKLKLDHLNVPPPNPADMDRPKNGRPFKYPWWDWFSKENKKRGGFTLTQGVDFESNVETMARLLRKRVKDHKWDAVVLVNVDEVIVQIK